MKNMKKSAKQKVFDFLNAHPDATGPEVAKGAKVNPNTVAGYLAAWRREKQGVPAKAAQTAKAPQAAIMRTDAGVRHITTADRTVFTAQPSKSAADFVLLSIRDMNGEDTDIHVMTRDEARAFGQALIDLAGPAKG